MSVNRKIYIFTFFFLICISYHLSKNQAMVMMKLRHLVNNNFAFLKHTVQPVCNIKYVYILQNNI